MALRKDLMDDIIATDWIKCAACGCPRLRYLGTSPPEETGQPQGTPPVGWADSYRCQRRSCRKRFVVACLNDQPQDGTNGLVLWEYSP